MMTKTIEPTKPQERIHSLDFLRGIAVLGILFINIENFAYPDSWSPWKYGFQNSLDYSTRFWVYFLTQGKFYTMFALLFGVSFVIFLERLEYKKLGLKSIDIYTRRLLLLFIIGIVHYYFIWDGDVLYHYAICGLFLIPFKSFKNKNLLIVILILSTLLLVKSHDQTMRTKDFKNNYLTAIEIPVSERTNQQIKSIDLWKNRTKKKEPISFSGKIKKESYLSGLTETYKRAKVHKGLIYYQGLLFPSLLVMLIGVFLYKSGIFADYKVWTYYWLITITILAIGLIINYMRYYHWTYEYYNPITSLWKGWLFTFTKEILGVGYVLILNGIYQKLIKSPKLLLSSVGKMALSNYIFQSLTLGFLFYGYGFSMFNQYSRFELIKIVVIVWVAQLFLSWIWLKKFNQGPLESLWKKLTYRTK